MARDAGSMRPVGSLTVVDFMRHPVWSFVPEDHERDEARVRPEPKWPVATLDGRIVGTRVVFANGAPVWAVISNIDVRNARRTSHFLLLSIERDGRWFDLARYFDLHRATQGPEQLAEHLKLDVESVFPIAYDLRAYAKGDPSALVGAVFKEPTERLSRAELIALAVP